jgi:hypothetical protein
MCLIPTTKRTTKPGIVYYPTTNAIRCGRTKHKVNSGTKIDSCFGCLELSRRSPSAGKEIVDSILCSARLAARPSRKKYNAETRHADESTEQVLEGRKKPDRILQSAKKDGNRLALLVLNPISERPCHFGVCSPQCGSTVGRCSQSQRVAIPQF